MNAKEFERLLVDYGASGSAVDVVVRQLRKAFNEQQFGGSVGLPTSGRGSSAHQLTADEMAWVLLAYAGSEVAAQAGRTLANLLGLSEPSAPAEIDVTPDFVVQVQLLIHNGARHVKEIRIARDNSYAIIEGANGSQRSFYRWNSTSARQKLGSEGIIPGDLLRICATHAAAKA